MSKLPGITREEEEEQLKCILRIADDKLSRTKGDMQRLEQDLHAMQEEFDESDKEQQALWHNMDARFREAGHELRRAAQARRKPYFGRIDFKDGQSGRDEAYYIGRSVIAKDPAHPEVIDWRAPIASLYYESSLGETFYSVKGEGKFKIDLKRKRTYEIENDTLKDFYDTDVVANDELLTKYLSKNKKAVLSEIIATIQQEQNEVIRKKPQHNMIIQGAAGSGKTTVAMHRISYILYNYDIEFKPEDFYIIGSNKILLDYITGVLPELNVYGVSQMTMEELFVRLLYEDWDKHVHSVKPVIRGKTEPVKGQLSWFRDLETFAKEYEHSLIPCEDVVLEKNHVRLMSADTIKALLERFDHLSRADKISLLTERLLGKLENEICGKYYSYTGEEKKALRRKYSTYFGKREWKGSIFEIYDAFLDSQRAKGISVETQENTYDVYDLAALAYLYKRLKETEIIREAGHVVIDEAQDFGMMAYASLKYCLSTCTYTIMGDVSQNIYMDYGLNDWRELRELMLPGEFDYFGLLRKSYRNTIEISDFSTNILHHGNFQVYPVQPIIRHGEEVKTIACEGKRELLRTTARTVEEWQQKGLDTIAIICKDQEQTKEVQNALQNRLTLQTAKADPSFGNGVMVLPLEMTKGLEFDAVLIYDASAENYPAGDGQVKRLYVAATRALHELTVLYSGELTDVIAAPVSSEKMNMAVVEPSKPTRKPLPQEEEKTNAEIAVELAARGEKELHARNYIGPRRIEISEAQKQKISATSAIVRLPVSTKSEAASIETVSIQKTNKERSGSVKLPSYYEQKMAEGITGGKTTPVGPAKRMLSEFGSMPSQEELKPEGHSRIDCSVRMCMKGKDAVDIISSYGTLRIAFPENETARVLFTKGQATDLNMAQSSPQFSKTVSFQCRETRDAIEISTKALTVKVNRKSGEISFLNTKGTVMLSEKDQLPRQIGTSESYIYLAFGKKEELYAKHCNAARLPLKIGPSAKVISYGEDSHDMPALRSSSGYELYFPADRKVLCCNIPMYGPYVRIEGTILEYYFRICR